MEIKGIIGVHVHVLSRINNKTKRIWHFQRTTAVQ